MVNDSRVDISCRDLENLLQNYFGQNVKVMSCSVENLLSLGDNFASDMKKINAKIRRNENSPIENYDLVAKKALVDIDNIGDWNIMMNREIFMYKDIIPFYTRIELENGKKNEDIISNYVPKMYGYRMFTDTKSDIGKEDQVIILENIKVKGYYVLNKKDGLDLTHAAVAVEVLAKFHALGIVAKKKYPDEFEKIKSVAKIPGFYNLHGGDEFRKRVVNMIKNDTRFNKYGTIVEEIEARHKNNRNYEMVTNDPWSTISHCDYWTNNIMFHRDEAGLIDNLKFVDFQSYSFSNIFVDLSYFLCTSLDDNAILNHFDDLLDLYYATFITYLEDMRIDSNEFSREKFDEQFRNDSPHELLHNIIALFYFTVDNDQAKNHDDIMEAILSCRGNDSFFRKLTHLFKIYEEKNWLQ